MGGTREIVFEMVLCYEQLCDQMDDIIRFEQCEIKSLYDAWERYKLIINHCPSDNLNELV